jgi:hypothetical protein
VAVMTNKRRCVIADTMARYWLAADVLAFSGSPEPLVHGNFEGVDVEEAFDSFDSRGETVASRDPITLAKILHGKACLNFHIKLWAEGLSDVPLWELREDTRLSFVPEWAWGAVAKQGLDRRIE